MSVWNKNILVTEVTFSISLMVSIMEFIIKQLLNTKFYVFTNVYSSMFKITLVR